MKRKWLSDSYWLKSRPVPSVAPCQGCGIRIDPVWPYRTPSIVLTAPWGASGTKRADDTVLIGRLVSCSPSASSCLRWSEIVSNLRCPGPLFWRRTNREVEVGLSRTRCTSSFASITVSQKKLTAFHASVTPCTLAWTRAERNAKVRNFTFHSAANW